jgi:translin
LSGPGTDAAALAGAIRARLDAVNAAREAGLGACRRTIRASGSAIRALHRQQPQRVAALLAEAEEALRQAQEAVRPHPAVAFAGFLHDAEKEYAEAVLTGVLIRGEPLPSSDELGVELPAWLNGLAEAASELRRHLLDRLRAGQLGVAEQLLSAMEDVYDLVVSVDYPDAVTGGLRRTADALRAVLERTRSDLTVTLLQARLQAALDRRLGEAGDRPAGSRSDGCGSLDRPEGV